MKGIAFFTFLFVFGLADILMLRYIQANQPKSPFTPTQSSFALNPPEKAVEGTIAERTGKIEKLSREDEQYHEASPGGKILQGESLVTHPRSSATVELPNLLTVAFNALTEISFVNLIPDSLLLRQKSGTATYTLVNDKNPLSIRVLSTLVEISSGQTTIEVDDRDVELIVKTGDVKIAAVDSENNTKVTTLSGGESAFIDGATNRVEVD